MKNIKNIITCAIFAAFLLVMSAICYFAPKDTFSESERRPLEKMPELNFGTILNGRFMAGFEEYTVDAFPLRDTFRSIKAMSQLYAFNRSDNNGIYIHDGHVSDADYPMNDKKLEYAASRFGHVYNKLLKDKNCNIYFSIIPDKNYFLAQDAGQLHIDYDRLFSEFPEKVGFAEYIDIRDELGIDDFYKTDTHWRQENLISVAKKLSHAMGNDPDSSFEKKELGVDFRGVYHGQSALPLPSEKIYYLTNSAIENAKAYDHENMKEIEVYDMTKKDFYDPYEVFLSGPLSLVTIENESAKSDKHLVLFRDSFGSSLAPLFVEDYSKITLVDIRYIMPDILPMLVNFENADVLFIYSSMVLNNSDTLK